MGYLGLGSGIIMIYGRTDIVVDVKLITESGSSLHGGPLWNGHPDVQADIRPGFV
jgi:hypothetical protein